MNKLKYILITLMLLVSFSATSQIGGFKRLIVREMPKDSIVYRGVGINNENELVWFPRDTVGGGGGGFNPTPRTLPKLNFNGDGWDDSNIFEDQYGTVTVNSGNYGSNFKLPGLTNGPDPADQMLLPVGGYKSALLKSGSYYYVALSEQNKVVKISAWNKTVVDFGTTGAYPRDIAMASDGTIYTANTTAKTITKITPDGVSSLYATLPAEPSYLAINSVSGVIYVTMPFSSTTKIARVSTSGVVTNITPTHFVDYPNRVVSDNNGNIYINNRYGGNVLKFDASNVETIHGTLPPEQIQDIAINKSNGDIFTANYGSKKVYKIALDGTTTLYADLSDLSTGPEYVAVDGDFVYVTASISQTYKLNAFGEKRAVGYNPDRNPFWGFDGDLFYVTYYNIFKLMESKYAYMGVNSDSMVELDSYISKEHSVVTLPWQSIEYLNEDVEGKGAVTKEYLKYKLDSYTPPVTPVADATTSTKGVIQLAGDLGGTAASPTVIGLANKANIASPAFTGVPTAPTATAGTNTTQLATTAFVGAALVSSESNLVHKTGAEVIGGAKTFTSSITLGSTMGINETNIRLGSNATPTTSSNFVEYGRFNNDFYFQSANTGFSTRLLTGSLTANRALTMPNSNGTVAISVNGNYADSLGNVFLDLSGAGGGSAPDATTSVKGIVKLAGDLSGTADLPTIKSSVALSGAPTAPTATIGTNTTQLATTEFVLANSINIPHLKFNNTDKTVWNAGFGSQLGNTSFGESAMRSATAAGFNAAFGYLALAASTTGSDNTAIGSGSLSYTATTTQNSALGNKSLERITTGNDNIGVGYLAGAREGAGAVTTDAGRSVFLGSGTRPLANGQTNQIVIGYSATGAGSNTVTLGNDAISSTILRGVVTSPLLSIAQITADATGKAFTTKEYVASVAGLPAHVKTLTANKTLWNNGNGDVNSNTSFGEAALNSNTTGADNSVFGRSAGSNITTGGDNTLVGSSAGTSITTSTGNAVFGASAFTANNGANNTVFGPYAGNTLVDGSQLVLMGYRAARYAGPGTGSNLVTNLYNSVIIGADARPLNTTGDYNEIVIGGEAIGNGTNTATIGNQYITKTILNGEVSGKSYKLQALNTAPSSATATGTVGEIRVTADYIYVCIATNTWVRSALTTW